MSKGNLSAMTERNYKELHENAAFKAWGGKDDARARNRIASAVNRGDKSARDSLEAGGKAYFDYLWKEADIYEEYGGVRPVFEMEELES